MDVFPRGTEMFSARQIVRDHGGEIHIESEPGRGTRVSVSLPLGDGEGLKLS